MKDELDLELEYVNEMKNVDWHKISEIDAAKFGIVLASFNDISLMMTKSKTAVRSMFYGLFMTMFVTSVMLFFDVEVTNILKTIIAIELSRVIISSFITYKSKYLVTDAHNEVVQEIKRLAMKHPVG